MSTISRIGTTTLHRAIAADALICAVTGILMIAGANIIADITDLPVRLLRIAGFVIVPYVVFLVILFRRNPIPEKGVLAAASINIAWATGCFVVLAGVHMNGPGVAFVLLQIAAVLVFAVLELSAKDRE